MTVKEAYNILRNKRREIVSYGSDSFEARKIDKERTAMATILDFVAPILDFIKKIEEVK